MNSRYKILFNKIDDLLCNSDRVIVAIDGRSGAGKSTLGALLKEKFNCTLIHMDDFFLQPFQRTAERYNTIGANIDSERFLDEVLVNLRECDTLSHRKFDCKNMVLHPFVDIKLCRLIVVEGVYSMHPLFRKYYDFSVFLDISDDLQKERILKRNSPGIAEKFFNFWIPMEEDYFNYYNIRNICNIIIQQ